jgi:hypothetical protein
MVELHTFFALRSAVIDLSLSQSSQPRPTHFIFVAVGPI